MRRLPGSHACPQFDSERLAASLAEAQIAYGILAPLGGRRGKVDGIPPETNGASRAQRNRSFHNYADYALSAQFRAGLDRLLVLRPRRCAIMCSEAVWWRCHRRIIADYLLARGEDVFHLMDHGRIVKAEQTLDAVLRDDGSVSTRRWPGPEERQRSEARRFQVRAALSR